MDYHKWNSGHELTNHIGILAIVVVFEKPTSFSNTSHVPYYTECACGWILKYSHAVFTLGINGKIGALFLIFWQEIMNHFITIDEQSDSRGR